MQGPSKQKIRHTSPEAIKDCVAFIPIIKEQKKISYLLDCINKKIENNNAINDNLQLRLLYCLFIHKHWQKPRLVK